MKELWITQIYEIVLHETKGIYKLNFLSAIAIPISTKKNLMQHSPFSQNKDFFYLTRSPEWGKKKKNLHIFHPFFQCCISLLCYCDLLDRVWKYKATINEECLVNLRARWYSNL